MPKLAEWALTFWAAIQEDEAAREALKRIERDATVLLGVAQEKLTTTKMLSLVAAVGAAAKDKVCPHA